MPVVKLPIPPLAPDQGTLESSGLNKAVGAIYYGGRWTCSPYVYPGDDVALGVTIALADVRGFHIHTVEDSNLSAQNLYFFVANTTDIYRSGSANSRALTSATSGIAALNATEGSGIQFASYGNQIIATDFNSDILVATAPGTDFNDLIVDNAATPLVSYQPRARYVATIKNQLLIGHVKFANGVTMPTNSALSNNTTYPSLVMWSAIDDVTRFGDPATTQNVAYDGSDYQLLADEYGAITGLVGGDYAYIFKERAIYRMDGPPYTFRPVVTGSGTLYCNSIVRYYEDIYYWGPSGPTVLRAGSSVPENLGMGKVSRTINDFIYSDITSANFLSTPLERPVVKVGRAIDISGFADYSTGMIGWMCSNTSSQNNLWICPGKMILYSIADNEFSYFHIGAPAFFAKTIPQYHYDDLFSSSSPTSIFLADTFFVGGKSYDPVTPGNVYLRGFGFGPVSTEPTNSTTTYTFNNPTFEFGYLPMPPQAAGSDMAQASRITKVRPIYEAQASIRAAGIDPGVQPVPLKYTVTIWSKSRFPGAAHKATATYTPADTWQEDNGWLDIETVEATHHKIRIEFFEPAGDDGWRSVGLFRDFTKIEIEYVAGSSEGGAYIA